jgi:hypothetical protein
MAKKFRSLKHKPETPESPYKKSSVKKEKQLYLYDQTLTGLETFFVCATQLESFDERDARKQKGKPDEKLGE